MCCSRKNCLKNEKCIKRRPVGQSGTGTCLIWDYNLGNIFFLTDITQTRVVTGDHISFLRTTLLTVLILVVLILISGLVVILKNILRKRTSLEREGETTDVNQNPNENQYLQPVDSEIGASSSWRTNQYDYPSCHTRKITYESRIEEREEVFGIDRSDYCILAKVEEDSGYQPLKKYKVYQEND